MVKDFPDEYIITDNQGLKVSLDYGIVRTIVSREKFYDKLRQIKEQEKELKGK